MNSNLNKSTQQYKQMNEDTTKVVKITYNENVLKISQTKGTPSILVCWV